MGKQSLSPCVNQGKSEDKPRNAKNLDSLGDAVLGRGAIGSSFTAFRLVIEDKRCIERVEF